MTLAATVTATANHARTIAITAEDVSTLVAERTGSRIHVFSGSGRDSHPTFVDPVLDDAFERP